MYHPFLSSKFVERKKKKNRGRTPHPPLVGYPLERERKENYEVGKSGEISIFGRVEIGFSKFIYVRKSPS